MDESMDAKNLDCNGCQKCLKSKKPAFSRGEERVIGRYCIS